MFDTYPELLLAQKNLKKPCILKLLKKGEGKIVRNKTYCPNRKYSLAAFNAFITFMLQCTQSQCFMEENTRAEGFNRSL